MSLSVPIGKLSTGAAIPLLAYGAGTAWYKKPASPLDRRLIDTLKMALSLGYRHLDGAETYNNEAELGVAIHESGVPRPELFVTTKLWPSVNDPPGRFAQSLKNLQTDYVDLYLLHSPFFSQASHGTTATRVWSELEALLERGAVKAIGVSNFNATQLADLLRTAKIKPATNQIEVHPYCYDTELIEFCRKEGILVTAYGPLSPIVRFPGGPVDAVLENVAAKSGKTWSQILLKWAVQQGFCVVSTTSKEERMREFMELEGWALEEAEVDEITKAGEGHHRRNFWRREYGEGERSKE